MAYEDDTALIDLTHWDAQDKATSLTYDNAGNLVGTHERPPSATTGTMPPAATRTARTAAPACSPPDGELIYTKLFDTWGTADLGTSTGYENLGHSAWAVEDQNGFPGASPIGPESQWQAKQGVQSMSNDCSRLVAIQQTKTIYGNATYNIYQTYQPATAVYMLDVDTKLLRPLAEPGDLSPTSGGSSDPATRRPGSCGPTAWRWPTATWFAP